MINSMKLHRIVEYIKQYGFEFETDEVIEDLDKVLAYYDVVDIDLTGEEYYFLIDELLPLAEQFEFREAAHLAMQEPVLA